MAVECGPDGQSTPHPPQSEVVVRSMQLPAHNPKPGDVQLHTPPEHVDPDPHP
jgi:hypothetical protein